MTTARLDLHSLRIVPLSDHEWLAEFESGENEIDKNINLCCEKHDTYRARTFCAMIDGHPKAFGFYTLGISAHDSKYLDQEIVRATGGRPFIPFIYLNYLAVMRVYQNQGIGTILLMNAVLRSSQVIRNVGGVYGIALHALTDRAADLYDRYGFRPYGQHKYPFMVLPAQSVLDLVSSRSP